MLIIWGLLGYAAYFAAFMVFLLVCTELGDIARGRGK